MNHYQNITYQLHPYFNKITAKPIVLIWLLLSNVTEMKQAALLKFSW
jgi:hypothetical protein